MYQAFLPAAKKKLGTPDRRLVTENSKPVRSRARIALSVVENLVNNNIALTEIKELIAG